MEQISINEAQEQLGSCAAEVARIRARIAEVQSNSGAMDVARRERELTEKLLEGGEISEMVAPAMTAAQVRRAVQLLESALAEALDRENQAKGALRRARIGRMRELLQQERQEYDKAAIALMQKWLRVSVLCNQLDSAVGMSNTISASWFRLSLPRGIVPHNTNAFLDCSMYCANGNELLTGNYSNRARNEIAELLEKEGVK